MKDVLNDEFNLNLLQLICSGRGVAINISKLSDILNKHRTTIKNRVDKLITHKIIGKPLYPLSWLFNEYPLFVISRSELIRDQRTRSFIENDSQIYAAYFFKEKCYNTLLFEFHNDINSYQKWLDSKIANITVSDTRCPPNALFLSTKRFVKFDPAAPIRVVEQNLNEMRHTLINGFSIDSL